jgi:toxin YoeB
LKRVNKLIEEVLRSPFEGIGKPEPLKENLAGFWSRRIDDTHRLVYAVEDEYLTIIACRYHYWVMSIVNNASNNNAATPYLKVIGLGQAQQLQLVVDLPIDQWKNGVSPLSESCSGIWGVCEQKLTLRL